MWMIQSWTRMKNRFDLTGKVALITGGGRGLGKAMGRGFAENGATIMLASRSEEELRSAAEEIRDGIDANVEWLCTDMTQRDQVSRLASDTLRRFGRVDILVNNAGIIRREDAIKFTEKDWDDVIDLNLKTVFFFAQAAARQFLAQGTGGKIVNVASMLSFQGGIRVPSYTASKSGVMGITRLMANEWAQHRVNVNAIAPGYMATNNTAALRADKGRSDAILERIPAGRWGKPEDLAGPVVFLASSASDYVNGYTIAVDGGWLAR